MNPACQEDKPILLAYGAQSGTDFYIQQVDCESIYYPECKTHDWASIIYLRAERAPFENAIGMTAAGFKSLREVAITGRKGVVYNADALRALHALYILDYVRPGARLVLPEGTFLTFLPTTRIAP